MAAPAHDQFSNIQVERAYTLGIVNGGSFPVHLRCYQRVAVQTETTAATPVVLRDAAVPSFEMQSEPRLKSAMFEGTSGNCRRWRKGALSSIGVGGDAPRRE